MKVLFLEIEQEREWAVASIGPAFLAGYLRRNGHQAELLRIGIDDSISEICDGVKRHQPQLIGISLTSRQWLRAREVIGGLRKILDIPVIAGGLHATFCAENILAAPGFD
ncbi:MAG: cobalamin B12-binding domain-containing protein, partial [Proteobacteria bacterium]|nr:cobalamin B12-binding domain-containing protein [Pseudomonadota bacterium]